VTCLHNQRVPRLLVKDRVPTVPPFVIRVRPDAPTSPMVPSFGEHCSPLHSHLSTPPSQKQASFDFQTLIDKLPADEPRYFVLDWSATTEDDRHIDKIFFVSWVPDTCKAKTKMLYASSKQALRNALDGVQLDHQATDYDEVTPEEFNERSGV